MKMKMRFLSHDQVQVHESRISPQHINVSSSCGRLFIFGALTEHETLTHGDVQRQESDLVGLPIELVCGMPSDTSQPHQIMLPLRKMSSGPVSNFEQRHPQYYSRVPFLLAELLAHAYSRSENLVISTVQTLPG